LRYESGAAKQYGIRLIPTQIFYDAEGNEVYRHEGFMDKQAIKAKFAEIGVF
jgi:thioredoxin 1